MSRIAYSYCVIQYVHDSFSGESLNVAVALLDASRRVDFKIPSSLARVKRAFPDANVSSLRQAVLSLESNFRTYLQANSSDGLSEALAKVMPVDDRGLKISRPGTGLTVNMARTAEELLERFVLRCDLEFDEIISPIQRLAWHKRTTVPLPDPGNDDWNEAPVLVCAK